MFKPAEIHQQNLPRASVDQACPQRSLLQICQSQPLHLSGHAWCTIWRLWGALFFTHCTGHPMQAQNPSIGWLGSWSSTQIVKSSPKWKWHAGVTKYIEPLLEHEDSYWLRKTEELLRAARSSCWISTIPVSFWRLNGWFCPASSWMESSWITRPLQKNWHILYKNMLQGGRSGSFYLGPQNTASSSTLCMWQLKDWRFCHCCACGTSRYLNFSHVSACESSV